MIDKPTFLQLTTAYGTPQAGLVCFQIPDADPMHAQGDWCATLGQIGPLGIFSMANAPFAFGPTADAAALAVYAVVKAAATSQAQAATSADTAAAAKAQAVNAVVPK